MSHSPIKIYGDGKAMRCFIHVDDATEYLLRLASNPDAEGNTYNIGNPNNKVSMKALASEVQSYFDDKTKINFVDPSEVFSGQHDDIDFREPNIEKISIVTNYIPTKELKDIFHDFIETK